LKTVIDMTALDKTSRVRLGHHGPAEVAPLGLGCMAMSPVYGVSDEAESIATLHAALDAGVNLLDTGDFYSSGHNEALLGDALKARRQGVLLSVKFGALRTPDGAWAGVDGRPASVRNFLAYSLRRLRTDHVDIYRLARLDPAVPIEETVGAIADMIRAGYVRYVGLSEVSAQTVERAHWIHPISDLQIEYSLLSRGPEGSIFPKLRELGVGVTAYGVLSRGLLSGSRPKDAGDSRAHFPRFCGANLAANQHLVQKLSEAASSLGATATEVAIAWVMTRLRALGLDAVTLVGARTRHQLGVSLAGSRLQLSPAAMARIEAAVPPESAAGARYGPAAMADLDSEKPPAC
jgi:aryl-alcohol dehydrogenase-like predicted oxidoreductase